MEPPRFWRRLLRVSVPAPERDAVEGELREGLRDRLRRDGRSAARKWYRRQVAGFVFRAPSAYRMGRRRDGRGRYGMGGFERFGLDLKWALRGLGRRPGFTALVVATLALGIGANGAIFTLINAHFLTPLPYEDAGRLVSIWESGDDGTGRTTVTPGSYLAWRDRTSSFSDVASFNIAYAVLSGEVSQAAERVTASAVVPHFFDVLGADLLMGSAFDEATARAADGRVVVLSEGLWRRRYGADPGVVGRDIRVDGQPHRVVGVLPREFRQPERDLAFQATDLWFPDLLEGQAQNFGSNYLRVVARLAPEADLARARAELQALSRRLQEQDPETMRERRAVMVPLPEDLLGEARAGLGILLAAGIAVLLAVCANVANLTLARGRERRREFAVRSALGSGRGPLVRQILVESLLLALAGALVGTLVLWASQSGLQAIQLRFYSSLVPARLDLRVIAFTTTAALAAAVLFGLPLTRMAATTRLRSALGSHGAGPDRSDGVGTTRNALIVGQVGIATALVVVAVLLSRSFTRLTTVQPGFDPESVVLFNVAPPATEYEGRSEVEGYFRELIRVVSQVPGTVEVGLVSDLPFTSENRWRSVGVEGWEDDAPTHEYRVVTPGYFRALRIPVEEGSVPVETWDIGGEIPVVVNRSFARAYWPEGSGVGKGMRLPRGDTTFTGRVVAVVADVLDDGFRADPEPLFYLPWAFNPNRRMYVVARLQDAGASVTGALRDDVARLDPEIPISEMRPLGALVGETVQRPRAASVVGGLLALIALLIAATGIYGVISYSVQSRTREIGIRAALGASGRQLESMILTESVRPVALGFALGIVGAGLAGEALSGFLFQVPAWDPVSLAGAALVLGATAFFAAWLPSRRAVRIDPRDALQGE